MRPTHRPKQDASVTSVIAKLFTRGKRGLRLPVLIVIVGVIAAAPFLFMRTAQAAGPVTVTATAGTLGPTDYATLKAAFDAINAGTHQGAITITIVGNTVEAASAALNASGSGSASYTSIGIQPSGGAARTISGTLAAPLIDLNGADNVTIDGLNAGSNSLTISNTSTSATAGTSTIRFLNDATSDTVTNCTISGSSTGTAAQNGTASSPAAATILLGASTGTTGNDSITISNNNIGPAGANLPVVAISSAGQSTSIANDTVSITGNNIFDFYGASGANGIAVGSNSSAFTISNNKFYESASRSGLASANYWEAIFISTASGGGYTINTNTIGFATNTGTGMLTNSGGRFVGIDLFAVAASPVSNIQGNTINGINWTTASSAATAGAGVINGIIVKAGGVNVGTTTGNTIGSTTGTGSATTNIFLTSTTTGSGIFGIYVTSSTGANISNNNVGAIATSGTASIGFTLEGIEVAGSGSHTITNNTIGNSTANNLAAGVSGTTTAATNVFGIQSSSTGTTVSIGNTTGTGNTVQNMSSFGSSTSSLFYGIRNTGAAGTININFNTFAANALAGGGVTAGTIYYADIINSGAATSAININSNTVNSATISTGSFGGTAAFIISIAAGAAATVSEQNNTLTGFTFTGATGGAAASTFYGVYHVATAASKTVSNNAFNNLTLKTAGAVILVYQNDATPNVTVSGNSIGTQLTRSVSSGSSLIGIFSIGGTGVSSGTQTVSNNNFSNITSTTTSVATTGVVGIIWQPGVSGSSAPTVNVTGNTITNHSNSSTSPATGIIADWSTNLTISGNTVGDLSTAGNAATGIQSSVLGATSNVFKNKIYNLSTTTNAAGITTGLNVTSGGASSAVTTTYNLYNNLIGNLVAPSSSGTNQVIGISIAGPNLTNSHNIYYNTVYLNASGGANFGTSAVSVSTTPTVTLRNNVFVNVSTPSGTGSTVAYRRNSTTLTSYGATSNNNDFYAGTPGASNLIFNDGTNSDQTLAAYKTRVSTRDSASVTENPPLNTTSSSAQFLHITSATGGSLVLNAGVPIATFTDDYDGDTRDASTPDIGADEVTTFQFSSATYSVAENVGGGTVTITVNRSANTGNTGTVQYTTSDNTATGGASCTGSADYVNTSGTLNFAAGDTSKTFTIPICDDSTFENNETVNLTLSNATGSILGSPSAAVLTINDNDTAPSFTIADVSQAEANSGTNNMVFTVTKTGSTALNSTVDYQTVAGTATQATCGTSGVDYTGVSGTLTFLPGDTSKTISVPICGDTTPEPDETFTVQLSNANNATLGNSSATGTITNDDGAVTYTWNPGSVQALALCTAGLTNSWICPGNWTPLRPTAASTTTTDILIFDGSVTPAPTVNNVPTQTNSALQLKNNVNPVQLNAGIAGPVTLTLNGGTGSDLSIEAGSRLTLNGSNAITISLTGSGQQGVVAGAIIVQGGAHRLIGANAGEILFQNNSTFTTSTGFTGNAFGSATAGSVVFASGSTYFHNAGSSPFGTGSSVVVFQTGSEADYLTATGFDANGRTYANLVIGPSSLSGTAVSASDSGSGNFQFDNLTINSTGSANSSLTYTGSGSSAITIQGNITSRGVGNGGTLPDVLLTAGSGGIGINKVGGGTLSFTNDGSNGRTVLLLSDATVGSGTTLDLQRVVAMGLSLGPVLTVAGDLTGAAQGYVIGHEKRLFVGPGPANFTFHVGTVNGYLPMNADNTVGTGSLTAAAREPNQPQLNASTSLQRYWTLSGSGITTDLTFHYGQNHVAGNESNYRLVIVEGGNATSFPENCPDVACVDESAHTIRRTGVTTFSDWTAAEPAAPTAVNLRGFTANRSGNDVSINWRSGYEVNNLGYNVYREQDGVRTLLTPSPVAGSALIARRQTELTAGLSYNWADRLPNREGEAATRVTYWLEDVDLNGTRTLHGPIVPSEQGRKGNETIGPERSPMLTDETRESASDGEGRGVLFDAWPGKDRNQKSETRGQKTNSASLADQQAIAAQPGVKLSISRSGWYRIRQADLIAAGLDPNANVAQLQLFANAQEVPMKISGDGTRLTSRDYIEFYGQGIDSPTDRQRQYYLIVGQTSGKRVAKVPDDNLPEPLAATSFDYTIERKERFIYFSGLLNGDAENFFGQIINTAPVTEAMEITRLDPTSTNAAQLEIALQGVTAGAHSVQVVVNGADVGIMTFANTEHAVQTFSLPAAVLSEGVNNVQLTGLGGAGDVSLADTVRLTYAHKYWAERDALEITVTDSNTTRIDGFSTSRVRVVDVTDPANVTELTPTVSRSDNPLYGTDSRGRDDAGPLGEAYVADVRVMGASSEQPHRLLAFAQTALASADAIRQNYPSSWNANTNAANYLIVTTRDFISSVQPLANLRQARGMTVNVIDVEDLYDEFSFGTHSPNAIHDFLQAAGSWQTAPHYVLFVGDASYDPKNYFGQGFNDTVPTKLIDTTQMETASDDWFADFNNDGVADLAVGRLPARSAADVTQMVNKIVSFENAPVDPSRGALLVADRSFEGPSTNLQNVLPAGLPTQTINRSSSDDATIHGQILSALNQGPRVANYFGHGSNGVWTSAPLLSSPDASSLTNSNHLSVFTMMTCFNGYFQDAFNDSLSEALLKSPGGAVAVWASTTLTEPEGQSVIDEEFYRQIFGPQAPTLGDAVRTAKLAATDGDVRRTWTLFGDPAMRIGGGPSTVKPAYRRRP